MKALSMVAGLVLLVAAIAVHRYSRMGHESARYRVLVDASPFQLRDYADLLLVTTPMDGGYGEQDGSFMRLFRYISGDNASGRRISMTTPVFMSHEGDGGRMSFVVPRDVAAESAPNATHPEVEIETMPGGRYASVRFAGRMTAEAVEAARRQLASWIGERGWRRTGPALVAAYDPPFTPPPLRRNEVLYRVEE
jgi:hypothetical protein